MIGKYAKLAISLRLGLLAGLLTAATACIQQPSSPDAPALPKPSVTTAPQQGMGGMGDMNGMHDMPASDVTASHATSLPLSYAVPGCKVAPIDLGAVGGASFANPPVIYSENGVLRTTLNVMYGQNRIGDCPVTLRSYNGKLVGPTLVITPGDTLRITLVNQLPEGAITFTKVISANGITGTIQIPTQPHHIMNQVGAFNTTNLHVHGMHVSPAGNSDNVLLEIGPGQTFEYEIKVPKNQTPGTYWYHAHNHGSTATQVTSGMAGAIIVTGGLDKVPEIAQATNQVFMMQQIAYDEAGFIEPAIDMNGNALYATWPTTPTNPNVPPGYFSPCAWEPTMREHTINGQLFPTITMTVGEVQRWRLIHAGVRESIGAELHGPYTGTGMPVYTDVVNLPALTLTEIAVDGIALGAPTPWKQVELEPGYRSDVLVQPTATGTYFLMDNGVQVTTTTRDPITGEYTSQTQSSDALTCRSYPEQPNFLAKVVVVDATDQKPMATVIPKTLPPPPLNSIIVVTTVQALSTSLGLTDTTGLSQTLNGVEVITSPTNLIAQAWVMSPTEKINGLQAVDFSVTVHTAQAPGFLAADHEFDPDNARKLKLGTTEEWVVNTRQDSLYYAHPFHIHVNPFQTWRYGPDGLPQTVWRDTVLIRQGEPAYLFTRYLDYIGQFVYHCHILDHEDQGMMELVEVVP